MKKYLDKKISPKERARNLLGEMNLEEKFAQMQCYSAMDSFMGKKSLDMFPHGVGQVSCLAVTMMQKREEVADFVRKMQDEIMSASKHNIPAIFHIETLTGTLITDATSFPCGIAQGATWNTDLQEKMGACIGRQTRALGFTQGLAPVLDICRDPRFGRQGEGYGEDPTLAAAMGNAYVNGFQSSGNTAACSKHFLGFMAGQAGIHAARTAIQERELREMYAKPFASAIKNAGLKSLMNSYASINGEPIVSNRYLRKLLREEMGFDGVTVSDYSSVGQLFSVYHVAKDLTDAGRLAIDAGMDQELPAKEAYNDALLESIKSGEIDETFIDEAVERILTLKFELGLFENPYPMDDINKYFKEEDKKLSQAVAKESMILLKNSKVLPLVPEKQNGKKIVLIGYHGNSIRAFFGGYHAMAMKESSLGVTISMAGISIDRDSPVAQNSILEKYPGSSINKEHPKVEEMVKRCYPQSISLKDALIKMYPNSEVTYAYGYPYAGDDESYFKEALELVKDADIVICTLGGHYGWNASATTGEGIDAMHIGIPKCQERFLNEMDKLIKKIGRTIPVIGIHFDGRPISSDSADRVCNAILEAWAPGEMGANAIVELLSGHSNPSGKLPCTVANEAGQIPVYYNHENGASYSVKAGMGFEGYMDGTHTPRYYFGFGLSYTEYVYSNLKISKKHLNAEESLEVSFEVKNIGSYDGQEVVQIYIKDMEASVIRPNMELIGFQKIFLEAGESKTINVKIPLSQVAFLDKDMKWKIESGTMKLLIGRASNEIRLEDEFNIITDSFVDGMTRSFYIN